MSAIPKLNKAIEKLERLSNSNKLGHGEYVCKFCNARGHAEVEHKDGCPIGDLWEVANSL